MTDYDLFLMNEDFDLQGEKECQRYKKIKKHSLIDFIINEKADEAYNQTMTNWICSRIRTDMGDIYIASPTGSRSANKIHLTRKGGKGAYQFEIKINNDGTLSVCDNSNAKVFIKTLDDGTKKTIILHADTFYTTKDTFTRGLDQLITWLKDNYDKYEVSNARARDLSAGVNRAAIGERDPLKRRQGQPKRTTDVARRAGITNVADYLRNGGNIRDLVNKLK